MSESFGDLQCGLTNDHVLKEPINLSCGHCICKKCVPDQTVIICKICKAETNRSELKINVLNRVKNYLSGLFETETARIKNRIKVNLSGLLDNLEKHATDQINTLKSLLENRELTLDTNIKYIEEEVEIRIESIKINLDDLFEEFKIELVLIKKDILEIQNDALNGKTDTKEFENNLNELRDYIKNNEVKTEEKFYEHQENFKKINKMIENFEETLYNKLDFKLPREKIEKKLIGEIILEDLKRYKIKEMLLNGNFETIPIEGHPNLLISLPNINFVCGTSRSVILFNEKLQTIKEVSTGLGTTYCALSRRNEIYVSVPQKHCIILFDLNLNQLKQFGSQGARNNQLNWPLGLCCHSDFLYICDSDNHRIQILTLDFDYVNTINIDYGRPNKIQISKTTIGVSMQTGILFFDLKSRTLKSRTFETYYETCNLNYIDSTFYVSTINMLDEKFHFFDSNGKFIEDMEINKKLRKHITSWENILQSGSLCRNKDDLYMTDHDGKVLLKFSQ